MTLLDRSSGTTRLNFHDLFDLGKIQEIQDAFAAATGVASIITDINGVPITEPSNFCDLCQNVIRKTEKGLANCFKSDAILGQVNVDGPTVQSCLSGGLLDGGTSIMAGDQHIASWLIGQVLDESCDIEAMSAYAKEIGADEELYHQALDKVTRMPREKFDQICQMLFVMANQMSQQALLNAQLAESEDRFKQMVKDAPLGIAIVDSLNAKFYLVNPALARITGRGVEELERIDWESITHPDDIQPDNNKMAAMNAGKIPGFQLEKRYLHADGTYFWVNITVAPMSVTDKSKPRHLIMVEDINERKRMEAALQQSETTFKKLFSESSDAILLIDNTGVFVECNQAALDLLKMTRLQFLQLPPSQISPKFQPDGRCSSEAAPEMIALAHSKGLHRFDWTCVNSEGGEFIVEVSLMPIVIKGQTMLHTTWRDITERKHAEERLREAELKLRRTIEHSTNLFYTHTTDHVLTYLSPQSQEFFDCKPEEAMILWPEFLTDNPVNQEGFLTTQRAIDTGKRQPPYQVECIGKRGRKIWVEVNEAPILENGRTVAISGTLTDITKRKKAEEKNERLNDRLLLSTRAAQLGVWDWNVREDSMVWDDRMFELYGVTREETPNNVEAWINGLHPEDKESAIAACQAALNGEKDFDTEFRILHHDGTVKHLKANGLVIMGTDGKPDRMLGVNADITEKKKLQEAQLRSSQLAALGEVAAGVAHEINNPINGVINYAQLLINKNDEKDKSNQILEKIIKEGSRISNIVHNLLNFAQKDRGEFSYLDLIDIITDPINLQSQLFIKDGIHIDVAIPDDLPEIYGNQMQLEQVVLNLLSNARHALNKKFPEASNEKFIVIDATSSKKQNGGNVQLRVKDFGCGIPKDHIDKIFNPFYTTKEAGVGTGLGLSVSHNILEKHGATISIDSQVNKFTLVTITFPAKSEEIRN